jgi:hypothetical protein
LRDSRISDLTKRLESSDQLVADLEARVRALEGEQ